MEKIDPFIKERDLGILLIRAIAGAPWGMIVSAGILWIETVDELMRRWKNRRRAADSRLM